jgi:WD40 repeat protein/DNA-binding SARP family transcriptional activator
MTSDTAVRLRCLGTFEVSVQAGLVDTFPTDKVRALLAYLALESRAETGARGARPHRREVLAGLLWPELDDALALANLRLALHRLRQTLDRAVPQASDALLTITRQTVQLNPAALAADAITFQELLARSASHAHADLSRCDECQKLLAQAVNLYQGELLAGFGIADAPAFEEWLLLRREMLHQQALTALHALIAACEQRGNRQQAHLYARRQLALDPFREESYRQLMRILAQLGLVPEALAQYDAYRNLLQRELGTEPDAETTALYAQIRAGARQQAVDRPDPPPAAAHYTPALSQEWGQAPDITQLFGRERELALLERWLVQDRCRLVAVVGIGGIGKTTLAAAAVRAIAAHFDAVVWRSLLNAPPLDELLRDVLHVLSRQQLTDPPEGLDARLALLLDYLRERRCLLVLDNLESILQPEQPGRVRAGYAGYEQLIQYVAEHGHQSCLLLTSREQPQGMALWEKDTPLVATLALLGLDLAAGQAMLTARGLSSSDGEIAGLVRRYSGNPLALKLVAQTVQDLFDSNIAGFMAAEAPIFDDIRSVLDQQFARLSRLEQEILIWLAIEREPTPVQVLRENLVVPGPPRAFLEALRGLRQRSLVEQNAHGCALQNVVTEYLTDILVDQVYCEIAGDHGAPSPNLAWPASMLNRYALIKATAKEYVRASQVRLILQPLAQRLVASLAGARLVERLRLIIASLREQAESAPGYAAGNILNLLLHLGVDLRGYDFSRLTIRQAYLQGARLPEVSFRDANLAHSVFTHVFGEIMAIRFDAAGQLLIAGLAAGTLCVWRAADGQVLREYHSFGASAQDAAFSFDGRLLVTSNTDHKVRVWDVARGDLLHTFGGHAATPWCLMFSIDGATLVTGGVDGVVHLWDVRAGRLRQTLRGHTRAVVAATFTRDGQLLATADIDGLICIWRLDTPEPLHTLRDHSEEVHALVFDATQTLLASASYDGTIRLWDIRSGQVLRILKAHTQMVRVLAISADGHTLASGGQDTFVCLWDVRSGEALGTLPGSMYATSHLCFRADDQTLAVVSGDHTVYLWHTATGQRLDTLHSYSNHIYSVDFSPDGETLASGGTDGCIYLWDVRAAGRLVQTLRGHTGAIYSVAFSPDGALLASAGRESAIRLWDIRSGRTMHVLAGHGDDVESIRFSTDGHVLVSASRDRTLRVWDVRTGQALQTLHGHTDHVRSCALSPDGRLLVSGSLDRTVRVWDVRAEGGRLLHTLSAHTNSIKSVAFSPDGRFVVSGSHDQTVRVWDVRDGRALYSLPSQTIFSVAFHPSAELLAVGTANHTVQLWDIAPCDQRVPAERKLLRALHGHTDLVECVRFSPDGRRLASASADETIRLWDVATGACLCSLRADGPYARVNIAGVSGISMAQQAALKALGAVEL